MVEPEVIDLSDSEDEDTNFEPELIFLSDSEDEGGRDSRTVQVIHYAMPTSSVAKFESLNRQVEVVNTKSVHTLEHKASQGLSKDKYQSMAECLASMFTNLPRSGKCLNSFSKNTSASCEIAETEIDTHQHNNKTEDGDISNLNLRIEEQEPDQQNTLGKHPALSDHTQYDKSSMNKHSSKCVIEEAIIENNNNETKDITNFNIPSSKKKKRGRPFKNLSPVLQNNLECHNSTLIELSTIEDINSKSNKSDNIDDITSLTLDSLPKDTEKNKRCHKKRLKKCPTHSSNTEYENSIVNNQTMIEKINSESSLSLLPKSDHINETTGNLKLTLKLPLNTEKKSRRRKKKRKKDPCLSLFTEEHNLPESKKICEIEKEISPVNIQRETTESEKEIERLQSIYDLIYCDHTLSEGLNIWDLAKEKNPINTQKEDTETEEETKNLLSIRESINSEEKINMLGDAQSAIDKVSRGNVSVSIISPLKNSDVANKTTPDPLVNRNHDLSDVASPEIIERETANYNGIALTHTSNSDAYIHPSLITIEQVTSISSSDIVQLKLEFVRNYNKLYDENTKNNCWKTADLLRQAMKETRNYKLQLSKSDKLTSDKLRTKEVKRLTQSYLKVMRNLRRPFETLLVEICKKIMKEVIVQQQKHLMVAMFLNIFLRVSSSSPEFSGCLQEAKINLLALISKNVFNLPLVFLVFSCDETTFVKSCLLILEFMQDCTDVISSDPTTQERNYNIDNVKEKLIFDDSCQQTAICEGVGMCELSLLSNKASIESDNENAENNGENNIEDDKFETRNKNAEFPFDEFNNAECQGESLFGENSVVNSHTARCSTNITHSPFAIENLIKPNNPATTIRQVDSRSQNKLRENNVLPQQTSSEMYNAPNCSNLKESCILTNSLINKKRKPEDLTSTSKKHIKLDNLLYSKSLLTNEQLQPMSQFPYYPYWPRPVVSESTQQSNLAFTHLRQNQSNRLCSRNYYSSTNAEENFHHYSGINTSPHLEQQFSIPEQHHYRTEEFRRNKNILINHNSLPRTIIHYQKEPTS